ncbi:PFE-CTERM domain-containing protein [Thalassoporum mexicanum]|uniref:PFE-CTERM domain-containing protein n=1 Tax=Thalassoporum mexicanum TaxID=3457544 RepID=UPI0018DB02B0|nr:hypothetical protein [Pseudanabaena sp. PCC 7367]
MKNALKLACTAAIAGGITSVAMPASALDYIMSGEFDQGGSSGTVSGLLSAVDQGGGNIQVDWTFTVGAGVSSTISGNQAMGPSTYTFSGILPQFGQAIDDTTVVGGAPPAAGNYEISTSVFANWGQLSSNHITYFWSGDETNDTTGATRFTGTTPPDTLVLTPVPFEFSPAVGLALFGGLFAADQIRRKKKKGNSVVLSEEKVTA